MSDRSGQIRRGARGGRRAVGAMGRPKLLVWLLASLLWVVAGNAWGAVCFEGEWSDRGRSVELRLEGVRRLDALRAVATKMGWSLVVQVPLKGNVDVFVRNQPVDTLLEAILSDGDYRLRKRGNLVVVSRAENCSSEQSDAGVEGGAVRGSSSERKATAREEGDAGVAAEDESGRLLDGGKMHGKVFDGGEAGPVRPSKKGPDRTIMGGHLTVERGEVVHDVVVMGGSVDVHGTVTGDLSVIGGQATVHRGGVVWGDASALGGKLVLKDGSRVMGDVGVAGGKLERGGKAFVGGDLDMDGEGPEKDAEESKTAKPHRGGAGQAVLGMLAGIGAWMARYALLFLLGAVLLAWIPKRMEVMQTELRLHPARAAGWGALSLLVTLMGSTVLALTIIGLPVALLLWLAASAAGLIGTVVVVWTAGVELTKDKEWKAYARLALGVGLVAVATQIPFFGWIVVTAVVLFGVGAVVATRVGGGWPAGNAGKG